MPADFDRNVAPFGIQNVKRVVVYVGHRLLALQMVRWTDVPYWCLGTAN